jgi:hypothetical protein
MKMGDSRNTGQAGKSERTKYVRLSRDRQGAVPEFSSMLRRALSPVAIFFADLF